MLQHSDSFYVPAPLFFILSSLLAPFSLSQFLSFYYSVSSGLLLGLRFFFFLTQESEGRGKVLYDHPIMLLFKESLGL